MRLPTQARLSGRTTVLLGIVALLPALLMALVVLIQSSHLNLPGLAPHPITIGATVGRPAAGLRHRVALERSARSDAITAGWIGVGALLVLGCVLAWALAAALRAAATGAERDLGGGPLGGGPRGDTPARSSSRGALELASTDREVLVMACVDLADAVSSEALRRRLRDALNQAGVRTIEVQEGCAFDASSSRVVDRVPTADPELSNRVAGMERPGYIDRGHQLRLPEVSVYKLEGDSRG
jgi:hypothetical protein